MPNKGPNKRLHAFSSPAHHPTITLNPPDLALLKLKYLPFVIEMKMENLEEKNTPSHHTLP